MNKEGTHCDLCDEGKTVTKLKDITDKSKSSEIKAAIEEHLNSHSSLANAQNGFLLWVAPKFVTKVINVKESEMTSYLSLI